jgi:hypothetical protein
MPHVRFSASPAHPFAPAVYCRAELFRNCGPCGWSAEAVNAESLPRLGLEEDG